MSSEQSVELRCGDWETLAAAARPVRVAVFVHEQGVPLELEWDEMDAASIHCVVFSRDQAVATGRLLPDGHIGRMAVLSAWRGAGLGGRVLERLVELARERGHREVRLHAQQHAKGFYRAHGFVSEGDPFDEAGIPHVTMRRALA
jgi:predicted GNAT family N-acyltransferase